MFSKFFSFFGFGKKKNEASNGPFPFYPKDYKLTSSDRKVYSVRFLRKMKVPVLNHLPLIEDHTQARFRSTIDVASKAFVLYGIIYVANNAKTSEEMIAYFKKYDLWDHVSPDEREYLEKEEKTMEDNIPYTWRIETLNVLLWALGNFDKLNFPAAMCDFRHYRNLPDIEKDPTDWIRNARLRDTEDILNESDLIYRIHWATRDAYLNKRPDPAGLNESIVMERHFALNWLTMYGEDWDDITTDT
jgi:hypothetical protein